MSSSQFTLNVVYNQKECSLSIDQNKTFNDVKIMIESNFNDLSSKQYKLVTSDGKDLSISPSSPFIQSLNEANNFMKVHVIINSGSTTQMFDTIDDVLKLTEIGGSSNQQQLKDDILDGFDNLLDLNEFDGLLKSTTENKTSSQNQQQQQNNPIDILSELEKLEDLNKKGILEKNINDDIDKMLGLDEIDEKQKELERQRKLYEEQQLLIQQQLMFQQQQQQLIANQSNLTVPVQTNKTNNPLNHPYQGYDPNITFVLDDDDDDDWVPRQEDIIRKEKQREKERKEREKMEKKMKKLNKKNKKLGIQSTTTTTDSQKDGKISTSQPTSPRDNNNVTSQPTSPRDNKVDSSPSIQSPLNSSSSSSSSNPNIDTNKQSNIDPPQPSTNQIESNNNTSTTDGTNINDKSKQWIFSLPDKNKERKDFLSKRGKISSEPQPDDNSNNLSNSILPPPPPEDDNDDVLPPPEYDDDPLPPPSNEEEVYKPQIAITGFELPQLDLLTVPPNNTTQTQTTSQDKVENNESPQEQQQQQEKPSSSDQVVNTINDDDNDEPLPPPSSGENSPVTQQNEQRVVKNEQDDLFRALDDLLIETDTKMVEEIENAHKANSEETLKFLDEAISFLEG